MAHSLLALAVAADKILQKGKGLLLSLDDLNIAHFSRRNSSQA